MPTIEEDTNCNWLTQSQTNSRYGSKHREKVELILQYRDGSRRTVKPKTDKNKNKAIDDLIWFEINDDQQVSDKWEESSETITNENLKHNESLKLAPENEKITLEKVGKRQFKFSNNSASNLNEQLIFEIRKYEEEEFSSQTIYKNVWTETESEALNFYENWEVGQDNFKTKVEKVEITSKFSKDSSVKSQNTFIRNFNDRSDASITTVSFMEFSEEENSSDSQIFSSVTIRDSSETLSQVSFQNYGHHRYDGHVCKIFKGKGPTSFRRPDIF